MPRVSAAHEQDIRDRILAAATRVFSEKGYHSSTIQDVVRESGLSVGAIYTYFSGKDELIRLSCDQIATRGLEQLAERLAPATSTAERLAIAIVPLACLTLYRAWQADFVAHRRLARVAFPVWMYVSVTGVLVYWMLYRLHWTAWR